jgi:hypothetical protein
MNNIDIGEMQFDFDEFRNRNNPLDMFTTKKYNIKFYQPKDFLIFLDKINPDKFIEDMLKLEELDYISGNYTEDCFHLCRNAVAWIYKQLSDEYYIDQFKIIEGYFDHKDHCWMQVGDYILDLTLAQFVKNAPKIAITKASNKLYNSCEVYEDVKEWLRTQL